ncbi:membrane protein [Streptomyces sp. NRRL S-1824]|uniref:membrane protein n=1 Tax=Streptomyces sp. NRRL S-1824 TaxID=1463889 RepID=UPI0004CAFA0B|nr:membrane protein [Streptomyces sp. NRRL S-1824]
MSTGQSAAAGSTAGALRHVLSHLVTPLLMCIGMGLAYLGAFHAPEPHDLRVDVVGSGPRAQVLAQTLQDKGDGALSVRTVADRASAVNDLKTQQSYGAYLPGKHPELLVATASSDTSATVVEKVFTKVAAAQGDPLKVTDTAPTADGDPTGQGIFFLLVAVSIGSYASVAVIGGAGAALALRIRAALVVGASLVVSAIGAAFAGPLFGLVDHGLGGVWAMAWLYSAGILMVGVGLHTFLKRWTTLGLMVLFVMLNFTSSGGIFRPELQPGFFGSLHAFWNGAGFVEGVRSHVYFGGYVLGGHVLVLTLWFVAGLAVMGVAGLAEAKRRSVAAHAQGAAGSRHRAGAESRSVAASRSGVESLSEAERRSEAETGEELEQELEETIGV